MKKQVLLLSVFIFVMLSCNRDASVSKSYTFENKVWDRFNILTFDFPVEENEHYDILAVIRFNGDFPSDYLYINFVINGPSGEERIRDYRLYLKEKDGSMMGTTKEGVNERIITLREGIRFGSKGDVSYEIENLLPKRLLNGIESFGLMMKPSED